MWKECLKYGWWQKRVTSLSSLLAFWWLAEGFQAGYPPSNYSLGTSLCYYAQGVVEAGSAICQQSQKHVKIEKFCENMGGRQSCRGCHSGFTNTMRNLPGQWPPLNCPQHLLDRYEKAAPTLDASHGDVPMGAPPTEHVSGAPDRPLQSISLAQLKAEKLKIEKHILDLPNEGFGLLREHLKQSFAATTKEIELRKPAGQTLDQALAEHKATIRTKVIAEKHLVQAEHALLRAQKSLQQAAEDGAEPVKTQPGVANVMATVHQTLQTAGFQHSHLSGVAQVLGAPLPPPPPAVVTAPPSTPMPPGHGPCTTGAQMQSAAAVQPGNIQLEHPAKLASQLLGNSPEHDRMVGGQKRKGRSLTARRKLPA